MSKIKLKAAAAAVAVAGILACAAGLSGCHIHNYEEVYYRAPICVTQGLRKYRCSTCGEYKTEMIAPTGEHNYVFETRPGNCFEDGENVFVCTLCGLYFQDDPLPYEHHFENGVCTECGGYEYGTGGLKFFVGSSASLITYTGTDTDVIVPAVVEGKNVTVVLDSAFSDRTDITSVVLPRTVTYIGIKAFAGCSSLKSVTGTDRVGEIGDEAFMGCTSLTSFEFGENLSSIEENAFRGSGIEEVKLNSKNTTVDDYAFAECKSLKTFTAARGGATIGAGAFSACTNLVSVSLGPKTRKIDEMAFMGCSSLTEVNSLTESAYIGSYAFAYCTSLKGVALGRRLNFIGRNAFAYCASLESVEMEEYDTSLTYYENDDDYKLAVVSNYKGEAGKWVAKALDGTETVLDGVDDAALNAARLSGEYASCRWIIPKTKDS